MRRIVKGAGRQTCCHEQDTEDRDLCAKMNRVLIFQLLNTVVRHQLRHAITGGLELELRNCEWRLISRGARPSGLLD